MSIERELLERVVSGDDDGDFFISYDLYKEIYEFLVHPEQSEQEPVTDKPTETAMAVMPNGVCVSNVYDAYEEGRKSVMSEQEPVVKITSIHADGENLPVAITGVVLSDAVNIWDLPIKNNDLLFLAPPKREPLSDEEIKMKWNRLPTNTKDPIIRFARAIEKAHGITGGGE